MTIEEAIRRLENISSHAVHTIEEEPFIMSLDDGIAIKMAIKSLEADRTILKTLYAIREEMQYIKVAELQIYGANSWRFSNAIEKIIDKHLEEVQDGND